MLTNHRVQGYENTMHAYKAFHTYFTGISYDIVCVY